MEYKDYYKILGVRRDATQDEIKRAYRRLARKYHPDVSKEPDAESKFKELGEAYEVLKDPEKRAAYTQLGNHWRSGQEFRPPPDWDAGFEFSGDGFTNRDSADFSDFFTSLFGRGFAGTGKSQQFRGENHYAKVLINLEDAFHGVSRTITLRAPELDAQGRVITRQRSLNVHIPAGVTAGQQLRLAGQGGEGVAGAPAGDLYLEIAFRPHICYRVDGRNLYLELSVASWEAALGANVKITTPSAALDVKIPSGSVSGQKLRIKGRGIPATPAGDIYASLKIVLPPANSEWAKEFYRRMERELAFNPRADWGCR